MSGIMLILLFAFWIILNGKITLEIILFGIGLTGAIGALSHLLFGWTVGKDLRVLGKSPYFAAFVAVLFVEVIRANLYVMRLVPKGEQALSPVLLRFRTGLKTRFCRFLFANSITLTPGTITVECEEDRFTVHALSEDLVDASDDNVILRLLRKMEA